MSIRKLCDQYHKFNKLGAPPPDAALSLRPLTVLSDSGNYQLTMFRDGYMMSNAMVAVVNPGDIYDTATWQGCD